MVHYPADSLLRILYQKLLAEKISARIARHAQLRKRDKRNLLGRSFAYQPADPFRICIRVCHFDYRDSGSYPQKTVILHMLNVLLRGQI